MEWSTGSAQITSHPKQIPHFVYWLFPTAALELCTELGDVYNWWLDHGYGRTSSGLPEDPIPSHIIHTKELERKPVIPGTSQEQAEKGNPPEMFRMEGGST